MQPDTAHLAPFLVPLLILVILVRRSLRERRVKVERLWLMPVLLVLVAGVAMCFSQAVSVNGGSIGGTITDSTGAVVPGAQITVQGLATGISRQVVSDSAGSYTVPSLLPGNYSVTVKASGLADYKLTSLALQVDQNVTVNAQLALPSSGEVVRVQGAAPIIDAQTMTVGQVIGQRTVQEMPKRRARFIGKPVAWRRRGGSWFSSAGPLCWRNRRPAGRR